MWAHVTLLFFSRKLMPNPTTTTEREAPTKMDYLAQISQHARGYLVDIGAIKYVSYCLLPRYSSWFMPAFQWAWKFCSDCLCDGIFHLAIKETERKSRKNGVTNRIKHKQFANSFQFIMRWAHFRLWGAGLVEKKKTVKEKQHSIRNGPCLFHDVTFWRARLRSPMERK